MAGILKISFSLLCINIARSDKVQVTISDGVLEGTTLLNYDGDTFYGFRSIPYAKPPIGELRFKLPEENNSWNGTLDATQPTPMCRQPNRLETAEIGQEDCLYLNVFTKSVDVNALKPVMIYIHGGTFLREAGDHYGPTFVLTKDIVYVTMNYRLGVYGFINTVNFEYAADSEMIGNNGLKDQVLAMKWVQNNIKHFGGDPNQVTITGNSAGGLSVHGHVLSPLSVGLFKRAIVMSGTLNMPIVFTKNDTATPIAKYLGLNTSDLSTMMSQLRQASNDDLFRATKHLKWFEVQLNSPCLTCVVLEKPGPNSFISDYPLSIIKSQSYSKVPLIIGTTNREGLFIYKMLQKRDNIKYLQSHIPYFFTDKEKALEKIQHFYKLTNGTAPASNVVDFYTDVWFKYSAYRAALAHAKVQGNVFYYEFSVNAGLNYSKKKVPELTRFYGACHADELGYLFARAGTPDKNSVEERIMRIMVELWTNFAINGDPDQRWKMFTDQSNNYVNITNTGPSFGKIHEKSFTFWDGLYEVHGNGLN